MIVQNIATGREYEISKAEYDKLVEKKLHRIFKVISKDDSERKNPLIPKEVIEYIKEPKKLKIKEDNNG